MWWLVMTALAALGVGQTFAATFDPSALKVSAPVTIAELDLGKLKGDFRQLAWSPDGTQLYVQTGEHKGSEDVTYSYIVAANSGVLTKVDKEPQWATEYWAFKSDRYAPGLPSIEIGVDQGVETIKIGTGSAGAADRNPIGASGSSVTNSPDNLARATESQKQNVIRLTLYGETVSEFVNERPVPGLTFSWGPKSTGAIAFSDHEGRLVLIDRQKRKQVIDGTKDTLLPAWSTDGGRLAYLRKTGRKKCALLVSTLER